MDRIESNGRSTKSDLDGFVETDDVRMTDGRECGDLFEKAFFGLVAAQILLFDLLHCHFIA